MTSDLGVLGEADRAGWGDAFQPRRDIHAIAHQVAVLFLDHIAEVDADTEFDAALRRQPSVALDHAILDFNRAAHGVDHRAKLDNCPIAGALDDAAAMHGNDWVDEIAAQRPKPRKQAILVSSGKPAETDDVGDQYCCDLSGFRSWQFPVENSDS